MIDCIKHKAGCSLNWDDMSDEDKKLLAQKYETSVENMGQAVHNVQLKVNN